MEPFHHIYIHFIFKFTMYYIFPLQLLCSFPLIQFILMRFVSDLRKKHFKEEILPQDGILRMGTFDENILAYNFSPLLGNGIALLLTY